MRWSGDVAFRRVLLLVCVAFALIAGAARVYAQPAAGPADGDEVATAPVEIDGVVLFRVRGVSSYPAAARAQLIRERIEAFASDSTVSVDALQVVERGGLLAIAAGERVAVIGASGLIR